jgi:hypothetical protein
MNRSEMEVLLQAVKRVEKKLDIVIRAIYEHDEDIQDEYGRSQRSIEARHRDQGNDQAGDLLGECDKSSDPRGESGVPSTNRSPIHEANPVRDNGEVQRKEPVSRGNGKNQDVSRKDGVRKHATSKPNATGRHHTRGGRQGGSNGNTKGSN